MSSPATAFPAATVREVARLLQDANLSEISLQTTDEGAAQRLVVRRAAAILAPPAPVVESPAAPVPEIAEAPAKTGHIIVTATAVGLFRPQVPPLEIGAEVKKKAVLGVVESLKIPSEIYAPQAGKIVEILAENGQGVEWGQPLVILEPLPLETIP